ncbi:MAG: hypothetical protein M0Z85_03875 [Gammaproteobacteria bacterium]|nr:hypothetical protein [Gammaproteobacteria bacterium]
MHRTRIVLALFSASMLAASPLAFAGGWGHRPSDPPSATASAGALSLSASRASASQSQTAQGGSGLGVGVGLGGSGGAALAAGGTASSTASGGNATGGNATGGNASGGSASNAGNAQSLSTSYSYPRQTPMAMAGFVQPTIPCATARNAGASSPVVGLAFGFSGHDKECDLREDARLFYAFGQPELAVRLLCKDAAKFGLKHCAYAAPIARRPVETPPSVADTAAPVNPKYVTQAELQRVIKIMAEK